MENSNLEAPTCAPMHTVTKVTILSTNKKNSNFEFGQISPIGSKWTYENLKISNYRPFEQKKL